MLIWLVRELAIYGMAWEDWVWRKNQSPIEMKCKTKWYSPLSSWSWRIALLICNGDADHAVDMVHPEFGWMWQELNEDNY